MAAAKKAALGTLLKRQPPTGGSYVTIAGVETIQGPQQQADIIDVTTLDESTVYEELVAGVIRGGEVTVDLMFMPDDAIQGEAGLIADVTARATRNFQIYFPSVTAKTATFAAFVTKYVPKAATKDALKATVTLRVSQAITWA